VSRERSGASWDEANSFGTIAEDYDRWRPGPSPSVVEWLVPVGAQRVVDVGAGTGALSRLLVGRAPDLVAVEPDARMRQILVRKVPEATVLEGRGERLPLPDGSVDAVVVSSAWHWMDVDATVAEVARVLRPDGVLGVVWSGVDWDGSWFAELRELVQRDRTGAGARASMLASLIDREVPNERHVLRLPAQAPFEPPEHTVLHWSQSLSADQLVGMLGTFSGVIVLPDEQRQQIMDEARQLLRQHAGLEADASVDLPFRANCWRAVRIRA
jgi:SAM-dependent methyltransferase